MTREDESMTTEKPDGPEQLERDVEALRGRLTGVVGELVRRKNAVTSRIGTREIVGLSLAAAGLLMLGGGLLGARASRRRRARSPLGRLRALRAAASRAIAHPERVAPARPGLVRRAVSGIGSQLVVMALTALVERGAPVPPAPAKP